MSRISMLSATLGAMENLNDVLNKLRGSDPTLAKIIEKLDLNAVIKECLQNTLKMLESQGIKVDKTVSNFYGNERTSFDGLPIVASLKTNELPNGLGIMLDGNVVKFAADEYKQEWRRESKRLKQLFTDAYLFQVAQAALEIMGYKAEAPEIMKSGDSITFNSIASKAGE